MAQLELTLLRSFFSPRVFDMVVRLIISSRPFVLGSLPINNKCLSKTCWTCIHGHTSYPHNMTACFGCFFSTFQAQTRLTTLFFLSLSLLVCSSAQPKIYDFLTQLLQLTTTNSFLALASLLSRLARGCMLSILDQV